MNLWVVVYAIGAAQAALLALALWRRPANLEANRVLAVWIAIVGADLTVKSLYLAAPAPAPDLYKAYRLVWLFPFLYASLFYVYVRALTTARGLRLRDTMHLAGFALVLAFSAPLFLLDPAETAAHFAAYGHGNWPPPIPGYDGALFTYALAYIVAALLRVHRYRHVLRQRRSDADRLSLRWIDTMAAFQLVIWCIAATHLLLSIPGVDYYLIYGAVAAWVCAVGYFSLGQPPVAGAPDTAPTPHRERSAADDDERFPAVEARLSELMARDALYREPALTIGQVAKRSGYPEYLVSAVINRRFGGTFWDYINRHRVDATLACLADCDDGRTVLDIAYACGFTSKSTFNAAFKRQVGETPSGYRRRRSRDAADSAPHGGRG